MNDTIKQEPALTAEKEELGGGEGISYVHVASRKAI